MRDHLPSCRALLALDGDAACPGLQRLSPLRRVAHGDAAERGSRYYVGVGNDDAALTMLGFTHLDPTANVVRRIDLSPMPAPAIADISPPRKRRKRADPTAASRRAVERIEPAALDDEALARIGATLDAAWQRVHAEQLKRTSAGQVALSSIQNDSI